MFGEASWTRYLGPMPIARSKADLMCLAVYKLTGGRLLQGRMLMTVAQRLGVTFDQAHQMAEAAAAAGLVEVAHGSRSA